MSAGEPFFVPSAAVATKSAMAAFRRHCGARDHASLQDWAIAAPARFWKTLLEWSGLAFGGSPDPALVGDGVATARFFPGVQLSYAENLLRARDAAHDHATALVACDETGQRTELTRHQLRETVLRTASVLQRLGVGPRDHVVAIAKNSAESVIACLATAALGAVWSSVAPDMGTAAILARFAQLEPKVLLTVASHQHHGKKRDLEPTWREVAAALPTLVRSMGFDELLAAAAQSEPIAGFQRFAFDHPLFVLFSSGTTGKPKAIVHGTGGSLLEHWKEQALHSAFTPEDTLYFHTTCGWMMWNWQLSALACGTRLVLYDGSVSHPNPDSLLQLLLREQVTVFGTSPAYLHYLRDMRIEPRELGDWSRLRAIQSTGSILFDAQYEWVEAHWKHLPIQSISGGTDLLGCFVLGNPELPVWKGESQCVSLGLDVRALDAQGPQRVGTGELVCANAFPSRPLGFHADPTGTRFHETYFAQNPGLWTHGDFVQLTARGTARILGRSDGTLNIKGVRIGPAEIYGILQQVPEIQDSLALEQEAPHELGGSRLVLLVVLAPGVVLDRPLLLRVKKELNQRGSSNHVPAVIAKITAVPVTFSGKKSERAATEALHRREVKNRAAIRNPEALDEIAQLNLPA